MIRIYSALSIGQDIAPSFLGPIPEFSDFTYSKKLLEVSTFSFNCPLEYKDIIAVDNIFYFSRELAGFISSYEIDMDTKTISVSGVGFEWLLENIGPASSYGFYTHTGAFYNCPDDSQSPPHWESMYYVAETIRSAYTHNSFSENTYHAYIRVHNNLTDTDGRTSISPNMESWLSLIVTNNTALTVEKQTFIKTWFDIEEKTVNIQFFNPSQDYRNVSSKFYHFSNRTYLESNVDQVDIVSGFFKATSKSHVSDGGEYNSWNYCLATPWQLRLLEERPFIPNCMHHRKVVDISNVGEELKVDPNYLYSQLPECLLTKQERVPRTYQYSCVIDNLIADIGDAVRIIDEDLNVNKECHIIEIEYHLLGNFESQYCMIPIYSFNLTL